MVIDYAEGWISVHTGVRVIACVCVHDYLHMCMCDNTCVPMTVHVWIIADVNGRSDGQTGCPITDGKVRWCDWDVPPP